MSDATERGAGAPETGAPPVTTVPIVAQPLAQPAHGVVVSHRATQMSASAVPSTLESPKDPLFVHAEAETRIELVHDTGSPNPVEDLNGSTLPDNAARDAAIREAAKLADAQVASMRGIASSEQSTQRSGPRTMMSPAAGQSTAPPAMPLAPEEAVDAVLPPAAFSPPAGSGGGFGHASAAPYAGGTSGQAQWGAPGAHPGAFEARDPRQLVSVPPPGMDGRVGPARKSNTTMIILIVGAVMLFLGAVGVVAASVMIISARRAAATRNAKVASGAPADNGNPAAAAGGAASTGTPNDPAPRAQSRTGESAPRGAMGGTRARIAQLTPGALDIEGVRGGVNAVLPRIDVCFAASELEPPNHENVAYDLDVAASGTITRAEPSSQTGRAPKLDACVGAVLRSGKLPKSPGGTRVRVALSARIGELPPTR